VELPHARAGTAPGVANPVRFSRSGVEYRDSAPLLGADTASVLKGRLGLDDAALAELAERGVIA